jgi:symplekin
MAAAVDPVTALTHALSCPTDSQEQATALKALRAVFESQPATIPQFCQTLLQNAVSGKDGLFKRFTIELFGFALGATGLSLDVRTQRESG